MQDLNLYHESGQNRFAEKLAQVSETIFSAPNVAVINNGYFIFNPSEQRTNSLLAIDYSGKILLANNEYRLIEDSCLQANALELGQILLPQSRQNLSDYEQKILLYKQKLLTLEQEWLNDYARYLKNLLSQRISEGLPIIQHEAVRLAWADLITKQEAIAQIVHSFTENQARDVVCDLLVLAQKLVHDFCDILSKLAGGRAFLTGQAIEKMWLFGVINKVYFTQEERHE